MIDAISRADARPGISPKPDDKAARLREVAGQLEGVFVQQLFKAMRETVPQGEGIVSGGAGEDIFTGLLDQHLAAETPKRWESGVTEALYRQLRGIAGVASPDSAAVTPESSTPETSAPPHSRSSAI